MPKIDEQDRRIASILGDEPSRDLVSSRDIFFAHLRASLELPCEVTGSEDFDWEESFVFGPGDPAEYRELRKERPAYKDRFLLLGVEKVGNSEWMMYQEDLIAHVQRKSDGKKFRLGLSELKVVDKKSRNHCLVHDYAVWFINNR